MFLLSEQKINTRQAVLSDLYVKLMTFELRQDTNKFHEVLHGWQHTLSHVVSMMSQWKHRP